MNSSPMRFHPWKLLLAIVGLLLFAGFSRPTGVDITQSSSLPASTLKAPSPSVPLVKSQKELPFSIDEIVLFLRQNFGISPEESGRDYALFRYSDRQANGSNMEIMRIAVRTYAEHIWVAFTFREFNAMHYVAEFIEAPLFTHKEIERLYGMLYADRPRAWEKVGRFYARGALLNVADGTEVSFEFSPELPLE